MTIPTAYDDPMMLVWVIAIVALVISVLPRSWFDD